ncbi:MAG: acyl--CoA ligase [Oscillospiraceae bacterium]|nr:acyl--CoA ligase [Oscillospiraceae bacterium]
MNEETVLNGAALLEEMISAMKQRLYAASMVEFVQRYALETPDKLCIADPDETMDYQGFWQRIREKAAALKAQGVSAGDRVLARAKQRGDFLALHFAVHLLGAVFIPVSRDLPPAGLAALAEQLGADLVLEDSRMVYKGEPAPVRFPLSSETATILYTTGTTGTSKGIVLTHQAEVAVAQNVYYGARISPDTVEIIPMPISHSYGLRHVFGLLLGGCSVVLCDGVAMADDFFSLMDRCHVNAASLTPAAVNVLRRLSGDRLGEYADKLRYIQLGTAGVDAVMKADLRRLLPYSRLYQYYSSTEAGCACIQDFRRSPDTEENRDRDLRRVGLPAVNAHFEIVDENHRPIQSDRQHWGHIACLGPMNMTGYDGDPELTQRTKVGGYVISSDIGYLDQEGYLCFVGRADDIINSGGFKVAPQEVEEAAMACGLLSECACCGEADALLGNIPVLYAVGKPGAIPDAAFILSSIAKRLESYKQPRKIVFLKALPRNAIGKIQRNRCRERAEEEMHEQR